MDYEQYQISDNLSLQILPGTQYEVKYIYQEVFDSLDYQQAGITLKDNATVMDIGVNIGFFSLYILKHYKKAHLIAIEPVNKIYQALSNNLKRYCSNSQKLCLVNCGVGKELGEAEISYYPAIPANSTFYPDQKEKEFDQMDQLINAETVSRFNKYLLPIYYCAYPLVILLKPFIRRLMLKRLDTVETQPCAIETVSSLIQQQQLKQVDLLKIDAEGGEYDILHGIDEKDWPTIKQLVIETSNLMCEDNSANIVNFLKQRNYDVQIHPITKNSALEMIYAIQSKAHLPDALTPSSLSCS